jgi:hypothetical protein
MTYNKQIRKLAPGWLAKAFASQTAKFVCKADFTVAVGQSLNTKLLTF